MFVPDIEQLGEVLSRLLELRELPTYELVDPVPGLDGLYQTVYIARVDVRALSTKQVGQSSMHPLLSGLRREGGGGWANSCCV